MQYPKTFILPFQQEKDSLSAIWSKIDWLIYQEKGHRVPEFCTNSDFGTLYSIKLFKAFSLYVESRTARNLCLELSQKLQEIYDANWR